LLSPTKFDVILRSYICSNKKSNECNLFNKCIRDHKMPGLGRIFVEFTRAEVACKAAYAFQNLTFDHYPINVRFYPKKCYQKNFRKGLAASSQDEKIQLALNTQQNLNSSDVKLFPGLKIC